MDFSTYFPRLYQYNSWANQRTLEAVEKLSPEQLYLPQGHSWGTVHATLLHMLSAEWLWLRRWQGESPRTFLDPADFPDLETLKQRWSQVEQELQHFVAAQTPDSLQREVHYTTTRGTPHHQALWQMMVHVPNHSTHHRGELAVMFALMGIPHQEDDMNLYFLSQ